MKATLGRCHAGNWLWSIPSLLLVWFVTVGAQAAEAPVKLAIISDGADFARMSDLLTAELSSRPHVQVLERAEIEKLYREQQLSAANRDYLKLGQILGADGLLLMSKVADGTNELVAVRLVAVKPGVVIAAVRSARPGQDAESWAHWLANHFDPLLQKLSVPARDAIPISAVNLRSGTRSPVAQETERQLTVLTTERLTRERELFVLERRRLNLLAAEKELQGMGESSFWNGSYLLEGTIDRDGYSKETVTVDARLIPPQNGRAVVISIKGPRGNLGEVIERLVAQILAAMHKPGSVATWQADAEAENYLEEARWALKWSMIPEAQAAADAAWALGRRDLDVALMRGRARVAEVTANLTPYEFTTATFSPAFNADGVPVTAPPNEAGIQAGINSALTKYPLGGVYKRAPRTRHGVVTIEFALIVGLPERENLERAKRTLELYLEFSQASPQGQAQILSRGKGWNDSRNSDWYQLGIEALVAASKVLQNFYFVPPSDPSVATSLAELRALARLVATTIAESPAVRDSYFVGGRIATHDELAHTMAERTNIFSCMAEWGCFWQERPEDTLALYRKLMESPVFCYIHKVFWKRSVVQPRLVAWNENDRNRVLLLWDNFMRELNGSTNPLLQMEAKALARADATDEDSLNKAEQEWWEVVRSNREALVSNNVELFYLGWHFISNSETEAMVREYWDKTVPGLKMKAAFEAQKKFLRENQPYEFRMFTELFREKSYTKAQAQELLPLIAAYQSNLLAKAELADLPQKQVIQNNARSVDIFLGRTVNNILNPPISTPPPAVAPTAVSPAQARPANPLKLPADSSDRDPVTNIFLVEKFLEIPLQGLAEDTVTAIEVTSHHLVGDKLLLDLQLGRAIYSFDAQKNWRGTRYAMVPAVAILDLKSERWQVIECAETGVVERNPFYHHTTLWSGNLFTSQGGKVTRYDAAAKAWVELNLPGVGNCGLFAVGDRLFAATQDLIVEILDGGASMRILASNRRKPPVSALDTESFTGSGFVFGTPAIFGDAGNLRLVTAKKIFSWQDADWKEIAVAPPAARPPWIAEDHLLFFGDGWNTTAGIWRFPTAGTNAEYCLGRERPEDRSLGRTRPLNVLKPVWEIPPRLKVEQLPAAGRGHDLFLLMDNARSENIVNEREHVITGTRILPQDGYHAALLCFTRNYAEPQKVYLKFDDVGGVLPISGNPSGAGPMPFPGRTGWFCFAADRLYLGQESWGISTAGGRSGNLPKVGVWVTSLDQIDAEIARQQQRHDARMEQSAAADRQAMQQMLNQFDRNHDGLIAGEERWLAFADSKFVASQLEVIDTNHNDRLDAVELKYFDANTNNTLEADELAGIGHTQHLFAERWLRRFDSSHDGLLDRREFEALARAILDPNGRSVRMFSFPDTNHDTWIDLDEMEAFCSQQTLDGLLNNRTPLRSRAFPPPTGPRPSRATDQTFPALVEEFWREGTGVPGRPLPRSNHPASPAAPLNLPK